MKNILNILILFIVLLFSACVPPPQPPESPVTPPPMTADPEHELFSNAEKAFQTRAYTNALEIYNEYLSRFPQGRFAPAALMREAEIYTAMGNHPMARNLYKYLIDTYPASLPVQDAQVGILVTYYNEGNYTEVIRNAELTLKRILSPGHVFRIHVLMGDSYMAAGSAINAVYFYALALQKSSASPYSAEDHITEKLKKSISQLSSADITALLGKMANNRVKGYLLYQLGLNNVREERREDAIRVLSEFVKTFPEHENAAQARQLLANIEQTPMYNPSAIGCLLPLTGSYKIYGNKALRGVQLALNQAISWGGKPPVNVIIKDTGSDPGKAVMAVKELANAHVSAIIGPIITADAAAAEANNKKIPIITLTQKDGIPDIGSYVFRNFMTPKMQVNAIVSYAVKKLGLTDFGILYPDEKYGQTFMQLFWDEVTAYGGNIIGAEPYNPKQTDFAAPIRKLRNYHCDAVFIPDSPKKAGLIIPQLAFYDMGKVQLLGTNLWHSPILIQMAKRYVRGAIMPDGFFSESYWQEVGDFVRTFEATFKEKPEFIEAVAYDTAKIVFQLLDRFDPRPGVSLRDELIRLYNFHGVTGVTSFDESGEALKQLYLLRIDRNRFVEVDN